MESILTTACLVSLPFVLFVLAMRGAELFCPSNRFVQTILVAILVGTVVVAFCPKTVLRLSFLGASVSQWSGFPLLCYVWIRGIYLLQATRTQNQA